MKGFFSKKLPREGEALRKAGFRAEMRDGQPGLTHPQIGFIPAGKPQAGDALVAALAEHGPYTEGDKSYKCGQCGADVLVSRTGQETLDETPGLRILCILCAFGGGGSKVNQKGKPTGQTAAQLAANTYRNLDSKVRRLADLRINASLARPPAERAAFLRGLEEGRVIARAELNALTRLLIERLGVDSAVLIQVINEEIQTEIEQQEKELQVTGWDESGNPVARKGG